LRSSEKTILGDVSPRSD